MYGTQDRVEDFKEWYEACDFQGCIVFRNKVRRLAN